MLASCKNRFKYNQPIKQQSNSTSISSGELTHGIVVNDKIQLEMECRPYMNEIRNINLFGKESYPPGVRDMVLVYTGVAHVTCKETQRD